MKRLGLFLVLMFFFPFSAWGEQVDSYDKQSKITVTGEAVVNVRPNKIVISFGIETWDTDIMAAKQKNNDILKKAVSAMKQSGVPEKEIQTDHLSIEPRYKEDYLKRDFIGYFVRNTFIVTLNEVEKVEDLVTKVLQAGVNYIHGIEFQTTEFRKYREQARELALKAAKEKAGKMASVLGQLVGKPIQINENYSGLPWRYYSSWWGWRHGRQQGMAQNIVQDARGDAGEISDTIALGKISIRGNVTVVFELK